MPALLPLERALARSWPPAMWRDVTVLVAVSGGADSVALLRSMQAIRLRGPGRLIVGHFNHHLRGSASDDDEAFVAELCQQLGVPCQIGHAGDDGAAAAGGDGTADATRHGMASEQHARELRYRFLRGAARRVGARFVATAHTADDQAETVLHRILRGTGIAGLAGMRRSRPLLPGVSLIRPMLGLRRGEVLEYLRSIGQPFREDATNRDVRFTRNRIRHELLPQIAGRYNANVVEALNRLASIAEEVQALTDRLVADLEGNCVRHAADGAVVIDCKRLAPTAPYLVRRMLRSIWADRGWPQRAMSYHRWDELAGMAIAPTGDVRSVCKRVFPGGICAQRQGDLLRLLAPDEIDRVDTARGQD